MFIKSELLKPKYI